MYPVSDALKQRFLDGNKKCCKLTLNNAKVKDFIITETDILSDSLTIDRYCSSGNKIEVGSAIAAELTLTLLNNNDKFSDITFEGADVGVEIGFRDVENGFIPCGKFTVDEPPRNSSHIKLKALDYMMRFDREVDFTKISFPISVKNLLVGICSLCEVEISSEISLDSLPNIDQTVKAPSSTDLIYRQLLQWIAQLTGTCAFMDWEGKLRLSWFTSSSVTLDTTNRYIGGSVDENDITITGVTIKSQSSTVTSGDGTYPLVVENNQLLYSEDETYLQTIADNIFGAVGTLTYRPFKCNAIPMPFLYPLDIVSYKEANGNVVQTVITNHNFGVNIASALSATGETAVKNNYSVAKGLTKDEVDAAIKEAMKDVDTKAEHLHFKYSRYENGMDTSGKPSMTDTPAADTEYLGVCATNSTFAPDTPSSYKWSKIRGADGKTPVKNEDYFDGAPGRGVSKVETEYRLSISDTYLSDGYSWSTDAPVWQDGLFLWTRLATTYTDETIEYSAPVVDASWKKTSVVEQASKELNETLANALGLHVTEYTVGTTKVRYYHSNPSLTSSKSGDTILVFNANGFGVCKSGWNNGNPSFAYGTTFDGKAVWDILTANTINANLINAGSIKSLSGAKVQTELNLDSGVYTAQSGDMKLTIQGGEVDEESGASITAPGILFEDLSDGFKTIYSVNAISFMSAEYMNELTIYYITLALDEIFGTNNAPSKKPANPYFSSIEKKDITTTNIHCKDIFMPESNGQEVSLITALGIMSEDLNRVTESLSALQQKYLELEAELDKPHIHEEGSAVTEDYNDSTCSADGYYYSVVRCTTCGEEISRTRHTIPKKDHNYSSSVVKQPTCTENGTRRYTCSVCGDSYTESIPMIAHYDNDGNGYCDGCGAQMGDWYTITAQSNNSSYGSVSGGGSYPKNSSATLRATANSGYHFVQWDDGNTNNPRTVTVAGNKTYTACFEADAVGELTISEGVETSVNIPIKQEKVYLKFVPQYSGSYIFESLNLENLDPDCTIYDSNKETVLNYDNTANKGFNCTFDSFVAGNTYYLAAELWSGTGTLNVKVSYNGDLGDSSSGGSTEELTISAGETKTVDIDTDNAGGLSDCTANDFTLIKFVPTSTGTYAFESVACTENIDPAGCLFDSTKSTMLISDDDGAGNNRHFRFTYNCSAGVTYYIGVKFYQQNYSGTIDVKVSYNG